jgi:hypothetical protein
MIACSSAAAWMRARLSALAGREGVEQGACDAFPVPGFEFADRGVEIGQDLADVALDIPFHPVGPDLVPVGALDLDDDQHLVAIVGDDREVDSPPATRGEPPACSLTPVAPVR